MNQSDKNTRVIFNAKYLKMSVNKYFTFQKII